MESKNSPQGETESVLARLQKQIQQQSGDDIEISEDQESITYISGAEAFLSPEVRVALDELLAKGEGLSLSARERMLEGARRGLKYRRDSSLKLQTLLTSLRYEHSLSPKEVGQSLDLDAHAFAAVERGEVGLRELGPKKIVRWIKLLGLETDAAIRALERSLEPPRRATSFARTGQRLGSGLAKEDEELFREVESLLKEE